MGQLKLGATKKGKRKSTSAVPQNVKKARLETRPASKPKPAKPRNKGSVRKAIDIVHNDERELSDQDIEDFDEYEHFQGFLHNLDPQALAQKTQKQERPKAQLQKVIPPADFDEDDSEGLSSVNDDDLEDLHTGSEGEDYESDVISEDEDVPHEIESTSSENVIDYESRPRAFRASEAESKRLPIKLKDGTVQAAKVKNEPHSLRSRQNHWKTR